jgi:hypothetical protein
MVTLDVSTILLICTCFGLSSGLMWLVIAYRKLRGGQASLTLRCEEAVQRERTAEAKLDESNQIRQTLRVKLEAAIQEVERLKAELKTALEQSEVFEVRLEEAARRLTEIEASSKPGTLFQKAVAALVGLGVPGLVLLAVMATSGFAGAAAITSSLAVLGGPAGMIGGVAALIALGLASKAIAEYGYPKVAEAVVRGLVSKGESKESIRRKLDGIPRWIISQSARDKAIAAVESSK